MAPANHKKEGTILHPGACKHSVQYDGRPDGRFGVWVVVWNEGILSRMVEVCEELRSKMIDVCCLQEVRWRGLGAMDEGGKI